MATDWNDIHAVRYSPMIPPAEWPPNVRPLSWRQPLRHRSRHEPALLGRQASGSLRDRVVTLGGYS